MGEPLTLDQLKKRIAQDKPIEPLDIRGIRFYVRRWDYEEIQKYFEAIDNLALEDQQDLLVRGCVVSEGGEQFFTNGSPREYLRPMEFIDLVVGCQKFLGLRESVEDTVKNSNSDPETNS